MYRFPLCHPILIVQLSYKDSDLVSYRFATSHMNARFDKCVSEASKTVLSQSLAIYMGFERELSDIGTSRTEEEDLRSYALQKRTESAVPNPNRSLQTDTCLQIR